MNVTSLRPEKLVGLALAGGRYRVLSHLGEGNMAYVYKAYDNRLDTKVAIKVPKAEKMAEADYLYRFRRESLLMVRLTHPHVIQILDVGEQDSLPYVVMQFLAGGILKDRISSTIHGTNCMPAIKL